MSKIWRCPECDTLNQGSKCIICGYEIPGQTEHIPKKDQELEIKPQPRKNECEQTSLKVHNDNENIVLTHHSSYKSVPSCKSKSFIKVIAAVLAAVAVLGIAFLVKSFLPQNNGSEKNISTEKEQILTTENETSVSEVTISTLTPAPEKTETTVVVTVDETAIDSQKLCSEIITAVNGQRVKNNVSPLKYDSKAEDIANDILKDVIAGTYVKGTSMDYAYGKFDHMKCYYENKFDFALVTSKTEAAEMLLKYETENFSSKWLDAKYDYIGSAVYDYGDGTWGIVFTLCYNDEVRTTTTKAGIIIPDYRGLSVEEYTTELKRLGIPYQVLMEQSEDVSEGYVVSISGGSVGEYYNGIHIITVYEAFYPDDISETSVEEFIVIKGNKYSTKLSELDLSGIYLTNEDIKDLSKMTNLKSLKLGGYEDFAEGSNDLIESKCTPISDISVLSNLKNLTRLDLSWNEISDLTPLKKLTKLTYLNLSNNQIKDIAPLKELNNLNELNLNYNQIENINELGSLTKLTHLDIVYNQIKDIDPLKGLINLTYLNLFFNQVSDISSLSYLVNLRELNLETNKITDLTPLSKAKKISTLNLNSNLISDLTPISDIKSLSVLKIDNNKINNIDALSSLSNLTDLSLYKNEIEDISALRTMTNLKSLDLSVNHVSDISSLQYLTSLTELKLYCNCICDINSLRYLDNMESLSLGNNQVVDISPLKELTKLTYIDLTSNPVSEEDIKELNEALPNCYVWWFI